MTRTVIAAAVGSAVVIAVLLASILVSSRPPGTGTPREPAGQMPPTPSAVPAIQVTASPTVQPGQIPAEWRALVTTDPRRLSDAFARLLWTYDTRVNTYEQWRTAVGGFVDPNGPPASGEVARGMLPLWPQWEDLARQAAHARVTALRASVPAEMAALQRDPRAPHGWHGFVVDAVQEVAAAGRTSVAARQASISVVCTPRCHLWSVTPEAPGRPVAPVAPR